MITDYQTIVISQRGVERTADAMDQAVTDAIEQGWQPLGGVAVTPNGSSVIMTQVIIKESDNG